MAEMLAESEGMKGSFGKLAVISLSAVVGVIGANYLATYTSPIIGIVAGVVALGAGLWIKGTGHGIGALRIFLFSAGLVAVIRGVASYAEAGLQTQTNYTLGVLGF